MAKLSASLIRTVRREWAISGLYRNVIARRHRISRRAVFIICTVGRPVCPHHRPPVAGKLVALCLTVPWDVDVVQRLQLMTAAQVQVQWHGARRAKLTAAEANEMRDLYAAGIRQLALAERFGVSQSAVSLVLLGKIHRGSLLTRALELHDAQSSSDDDDDCDEDGPQRQPQVALWPSGQPMRRSARS